MSAALQMAKHHYSAEMSYVERVGCRVGTEISGHHVGVEVLLGARHNLREHAAPAQFFNEILCHYCWWLLLFLKSFAG